MQTIRIGIADDHAILRDGLKRLLEAEAGFEVVAEAASGRQAVELVQRHQPDVLLLDLLMPEGSGLDVLRALHECGSTTRTILLTAAIERPEVVAAVRYGVRGLVLKHAATPLLHKCIRAVAGGEYWLGHDRIPDLIDAFREANGAKPLAPAETLTARELSVVAAVVEGASNRDIAALLGMSGQTVKTHLSHIYNKVGVSNRLELALFAIHHKLCTSRGPGGGPS